MENSKPDAKRDVPFTIHLAETFTTRPIDKVKTKCCPNRKPSIWLLWLIVITLLMVSICFSTVKMNKKQATHTLSKFQTKYNENGNEIIFHKLLIPGEKVTPFKSYSHYLSNVAEFPNHSINVLLVLNQWENESNTLMMSPCDAFFLQLGQQQVALDLVSSFITMKEIKDFTQQYKNVKFTVSSLPKIFDQSKFESTWSFMPRNVLDFYMRVIFTLREGGTAMSIDAISGLSYELVKHRRKNTLFNILSNENKTSENKTRKKRATDEVLQNKKNETTNLEDPQNDNGKKHSKPSQYKDGAISAWQNLLRSIVSSQMVSYIESVKYNSQELKNDESIIDVFHADERNQNETELEKIPVDGGDCLLQPLFFNNSEAFTFIFITDPFDVRNEAVVERSGGFVSAQYAYHPFLNHLMNAVDDKIVKSTPKELVQRALDLCSPINFSPCSDVILM